MEPHKHSCKLCPFDLAISGGKIGPRDLGAETNRPAQAGLFVSGGAGAFAHCYSTCVYPYMLLGNAKQAEPVCVCVGRSVRTEVST